MVIAKPSAASQVTIDAQKDFQKGEDFLLVPKHCSGGDGLQNEKEIDVLRVGLTGGGSGKNGHSMVVALASASASEGAIGQLPVHSGGLANGSGGGGMNAKMRKVTPPTLYGRKFGSHKGKEEMANGQGRHWLCLAVLLFFLGWPVVASARTTIVYKNTCPIPVFPSLIPTGGSPKINNSTSLSAIGPNDELRVLLPDEWAGFGLFGTGCIFDGLGTRSCTTGDCEGRDCTAEHSPVATNYIISSDGSITMSAMRGYNLGLNIEFMCAGCGCPSASCKAQLESCPNDLRVLNSTRVVVGCKPGTGLYFSKSQCTVPGDYSSSRVSITCLLKNRVTQIRTTC